MGKVKIKKNDVWIDMTPMSDVMVLLLCFFMLTSTFVKQEPVKVTTPGSVSEIKVPEKNVLSILVDKTGKVFMSMDNQNDPMWGVPMEKLETYLSLDQQQMTEALQNEGIPTDSIDGRESEFQMWVRQAMDINPDIKVSIKCDEETPYSVVKKLMSELQDINANRYYLITSLAKED